MCVCRLRRETGEHHGTGGERGDGHPVLTVLGPDERLCSRDRVCEGLAAHRPRAVDREHHALCLGEVLGSVAAADGTAVLLQRRRLCRGHRGDDGHPDPRKGRCVAARYLHPGVCCRHRGERYYAEGDADPDPPALPDHRPYPAAKAGRAWTTSSRSKNVGGRATPEAAIFSRKWGLSPVQPSGERSASVRPAAGESSSGGFATKMSWRVTTSDSMRSTSVMFVTRREPSTRREIWISRSNALEICSRIAWSMSRVSAPRTSPTMIRSGRMRSAFRTSSRMRTSPWPSMLGGRDSSVITCSCWS